MRDLRQFGYQLTLAELTTARDHGVSPEYVRDLTALGYQRVVDALIAARDHGISPEYIRDMRDVGYRLTLEELTKARDHGVSAEDVRQLKTQGRESLTLDELVELRDKGGMPRYALREASQGRGPDGYPHGLPQQDVQSLPPLVEPGITVVAGDRESLRPDVFVPELRMVADEVGHQADARGVVHARSASHPATAAASSSPRNVSVLADDDAGMP